MRDKVIAGVALAVIVGFSFWMMRDRVDGPTSHASGGFLGSFNGGAQASIRRPAAPTGTFVMSDSGNQVSSEFRQGLQTLVDGYAKGETEDELWGKLLRSVERKIGEDGDTARFVCDQADAVDDVKIARFLGRLMRAATDEDFLDEMAARVRFAETPLARRAAIIALEGRPLKVWWKPLLAAHSTDENEAVRAEAMDVLQRHLEDERFKHKHEELRKKLGKRD